VAKANAGAVRFQFSMVQMMKLVVLGAVASLCLAPGYRLVELGVSTWPGFLILEGVSVPLALALAVFPLVRRGPLKDWTIRALLLSSVSIALGFAAYLMFLIVIHIHRVFAELSFILFDSLAIGVLGFCLATLVRGLIPVRCPECSRRAMIREVKATHAPEAVAGRAYRCLNCGAELLRSEEGVGRAVRPGLETSDP
jgi:DNA-directed RNA polymerase subunit RPC12/RpoP